MSRSRLTVIVGASLIVAGCAGAPPSSLVDARKAYQTAAEGPARELAPDQLHSAEVFLKTAERTYEEEGDSANMRDRAYVAMRKAQLADAHAGIVQANKDVELAQEQNRSATQLAGVAVANELASARSQLATERGASAARNQQLQAEIARREEAEAAEQKALAELKEVGEVKQEARGTVITLSGSVIFASGKSELLPSAQNRLAEVASALSSPGRTSKIVVEGHTDSQGSKEKNQALSVERAEAVRDALVSRGVPSDRVSVEGFGASRPIADNGSQAGRANNRRVEIVVQPST